MYNQKLAYQRAKTTFLLQKPQWKMHKFDENMMGNLQNISETEFPWKYLQFDTISSRLAQFDYE